MDTIGHPPAPDGVETCERADTREHYQSMVTPAFTDLYLAPLPLPEIGTKIKSIFSREFPI